VSRLRIRLDNSVARRFARFQPRLVFVGLLLGLGALIVAGRAMHLQVLQHGHLSQIAQRQTQRTIRLDGQRGAILDREGRALALSVRADSVYAHPQRVEDPARTAFRLARVLEVDAGRLERNLRSDRAFIWVKRQISPLEAEQVEALDLPGIGMTDEHKRVYPSRELASALLGFTGVDGEGLEGLEYAFNTYLKGAEGYRLIDRDALGRTVLRGSGRTPTKGGSVRLSIDAEIQYHAEHVLASAVERHEAEQGVAIVMHTPTGQILAMAHAPRFNPNNYRAYGKETFFNRAITSGFEPGSTMKVLTAAVALEEKLVKPDTLFFCENGEWKHFDSVIHDTSPHGWLGLSGIIRVSSNICAAKLGLMIPKALFREYLRRFGFGERLGVFTGPDGKRLAGEAEGYLLPEENWTPVDHAAISFGHGILVSPLQMVTAVNAIASGGVLLKPVLTLEMRSPDGQILLNRTRQVAHRVLSWETANAMRGFMTAVVGKEGTGSAAAIPGFSVAGKTGTTEVYDIQARGYSKTRHIASFAGFVPAEQPQLTILVMVESPKKGRYGGDVAAPVFREIGQHALNLMGVWPEDRVRRINPAGAAPKVATRQDAPAPLPRQTP